MSFGKRQGGPSRSHWPNWTNSCAQTQVENSVTTVLQTQTAGGQCTCESQLQIASRLWSTAWYWLTYSEQQEDKAENSSKQCVWVKKWRIEAQKHVTYAEIQVLAANKILKVPTAMHVPSVTTWWAKSWGMSEARRNKAMRLWISWRLNSWHVLAL